MIMIKMHQDISLSGFTLIEGFPGAGLVGPMAISYIVDKLGMKYVGHIESEDFPPLIAIHGDKPMSPMRVYCSEKAKLVTILAEFAVPLTMTYEMSDSIYRFVKAKGISKIVSIGGIPSPQQAGVEAAKNEAVFGIASNDGMAKELVAAGLQSVGEGVATGVSALVMLSAVNDDVPDISILVAVDPNILDPKYAELAIASLNKLINLGVDVSELDKEAKEVEAKMRDLLKKNRAAQEAHSKATTTTAEGPSMYA